MTDPNRPINTDRVKAYMETFNDMWSEGPDELLVVVADFLCKVSDEALGWVYRAIKKLRRKGH